MKLGASIKNPSLGITPAHQPSHTPKCIDITQALKNHQ